MKPGMDTADLRLLSVLQRDASLTLNEISERVHLSLNACWRRVKRLEDLGYVAKRVAVLDPEKLGLQVSAFVTVILASADAAHVEAAEAAMRSSDLVTEIHRLFGENAYLLRVYATTGSMLRELLDGWARTMAPDWWTPATCWEACAGRARCRCRRSRGRGRNFRAPRPLPSVFLPNRRPESREALSGVDPASQ